MEVADGSDVHSLWKALDVSEVRISIVSAVKAELLYNARQQEFFPRLENLPVECDRQNCCSATRMVSR